MEIEFTDDMKYISREPTDLYDVLECTSCEHKITYDELLSKYGPEGLYEIASRLIKVADEDMKTGIEQADRMFDNGIPVSELTEFLGTSYIGYYHDEK